MHRVWRAVAGVGVAGAAVLGWSTLVEPRWFALRRVEVPVLPAGARPVTVLHLSDLHLVPTQRHKIAWVRGLADLEPDLVVTTGDNLAHQEAVPAVLAAYERLLHRPGVFVLGSNDYFAPAPKNPLRYFNDSHRKDAELTDATLPTRDLVTALVGHGWLDLTNARHRIRVNDLDLEFVGVDDPHLGYDRYRLVSPSG